MGDYHTIATASISTRASRISRAHSNVVRAGDACTAGDEDVFSLTERLVCAQGAAAHHRRCRRRERHRVFYPGLFEPAPTPPGPNPR